MIRFKEGNLRVPKLERPVYVVAGGMTDYRKRYPEKATEELVIEAAKMCFEENDLKVSLEELRGMVNFCVYSQFADHFGDQLLAEARVNDALGFDPLGNFGVKTGGATGGSSVLAGVMAVASGYASCVPVVGWERMDEVGTREGNSYIASAADKNFESELGWIYTSYYALMAQRYLYENDVSREVLAKIAVKNRGYAQYSPFSQAPADISEQDVLESRYVSDPLSFLDCCLMSTGAACLILCDEETAFKISDDPIKITMGAGSHTLRTADRRDMEIPLLPNESPDMYKDYKWEYPGFSSFLAARMAAYYAYNAAGIHDPVEDFDLLETHDAFTISDIQTYEDIGLRPYGKGREFIESGDAYFEGRLANQPDRRAFGNDALGRRDRHFSDHRNRLAVAGQVEQIPRRSANVDSLRQNQTGKLPRFASAERPSRLRCLACRHRQPRYRFGFRKNKLATDEHR